MAARIAIDSFWLPLAPSRRPVAFRRAGRGASVVSRDNARPVAIRHGRIRGRAGTNLFQYNGSELMREGEHVCERPVASDSSYAIICLLVALFLRSLPRVFRVS